MGDGKGPFGIYITNPPAKSSGGGFNLWGWLRIAGLFILVTGALKLFSLIAEWLK